VPSAARCATLLVRLELEPLPRFSLHLLLHLHALAPLCAVGKHLPCGFGPAASLAHMVERRRVSLGSRLLGTGEEELEAGAADDHPLGHATYSALPAASWVAAESSVAFRFTAAILPRRSGAKS